MPYYRTETYTTTGTKGSWNTDPSIVPFNCSVNCTVTGSATYSLQYSFDPLSSPTAVDSDAVWITSVDIPVGTVVSQQTAFVVPVARIRVVIAAVSGSVKVEMAQGLSTN